MAEVVTDVTFNIPENDGNEVSGTRERIATGVLKHVFSNIPADRFGDLDKLAEYSILSNLTEVLANSLDANSARLRVRIKFNKQTDNLIITLGDNGDGVNAHTTNQKNKDHLGGAGIGLENIKFCSDVRLFRNDKGAIVTIKMNLRYLSEFGMRKYLVEEFKNGKMSEEDFKMHLKFTFEEMVDKITSDIKSGKLTQEKASKLVNQYCDF